MLSKLGLGKWVQFDKLDAVSEAQAHSLQFDGRSMSYLKLGASVSSRVAQARLSTTNMTYPPHVMTCHARANTEHYESSRTNTRKQALK